MDLCPSMINEDKNDGHMKVRGVIRIIIHPIDFFVILIYSYGAK
jgi:hypothetical protein